MGRINIVDDKIFNLINKFKYYIFIVIISLLALIIRYKFFYIQSTDYLVFLKPWVDYMKNNDGIFALKSVQSDYNMPYLYILAIISYIKSEPLFYIKIVSVFFDFVLAFACGITAMNIKNTKNKFYIFCITYSAVLFIPTVVLNGSAWGQCDVIYTSFVIFSIYYMLKNKYTYSFIFFGIAFTFKLQAIFMLPIYIILYLKNKKFSIVNFIIIPIVSIILYIPALLVGVRINKLWEIYIGQVKSVSNVLIFNFPSIYNLLPEQGEYLQSLGIIFVFVIIGIITLFLLENNTTIKQIDIIKISLLLIVIITYLLPSMHDRYMFVADILSIIYFICTKNIVYAAVINFMSLNVYSRYLFGNQIINLKICAIIQLILVLIMIRDFFLKRESVK